MSPKVGTVEKEQIRDSVWAAAARTLTGFSAKAIFDLPIFDSIYPSVAPAASVSADTFGAWVQISANVGVGKRLIGIQVSPEMAVSRNSFEIEIGEGGSGAEVAIARVQGIVLFLSVAAWTPMLYYPLWKALSDNARLSARVRNTAAAAYAYDVAVLIA